MAKKTGIKKFKAKKDYETYSIPPSTLPSKMHEKPSRK